MSFVRYVSGQPQTLESKMTQAVEPSAVFSVPGVEPVERISPSHEAAVARYRGDSHPREQRKPALVATDLMSAKVICVAPTALASEVKALMVQNRFHHLPVVDGGRLVGIISDRDLLANASKPNAMVKAIMSHDVLTARPGARVADMAKVMVEHVVSSLPIVNDLHQVVGIVTRTDVLRCVMQHAPLDLWV